MSTDSMDRAAGLENELQDQPLTLPSGGILSLINLTEIKEMARQKYEQHKTALLDIAKAREVAVKLADQITGIGHWFYAGNQEFVGMVKNDSDNPAMRAYRAILDTLRTLLQNGSVEECDGKFYIGAEKLHCVIPSRLAAMSSLSQLVNPRHHSESEELRALTLQEIGEIALDIGAVTVIGKPSRFVIDKQYLSIDTYLTEEELAEFNQYVDIILFANKKTSAEASQQRKMSIKDQVTVNTIEEALEKGGIYLATIPDQQHDGKTIFGGQMLFCFDAKRRTVNVDCRPPFTDGHKLFCDSIDGIKRESAEISFEDVNDLLKEDLDHPNGRREKPDLRLWYYMQNHINWLCNYRAEEDLISSMRKDGDLTTQEFLGGKLGNIVLKLERFRLKNEDISPAAIKVSRILVGSDKALLVIEANPGMMPVVSTLIGEDKVFPENNLPGALGKFVENWKQTHSAK